MDHRAKGRNTLQKIIESIRCVARHTDDLYIILDRYGRLQYLNDHASGCLAGCPQDLMGKPVWEILPSASENFRQRLETAVASAASLSFEYRLVHNGRTSWLAFNLSPIEDGDGGMIGLLCAARDISERKGQEELIARSKSDWLRAVDGMPHLLAVVDTNFRIERINTNMAERLKLSVRNVVGMICYQTIHGLSRPPAFCPLTKTRTAGEHLEIENITERHLGCDFISVTPLRDVHGSVSGCLYIGHPISALSGDTQTAQCIRTLMRSVDYIVRIQDIEGRYLFLTAIEAGNLRHAEVGGRSPFDFFEPGLAAKMVERVSRVAEGEKELTEASEVRWKGETFHFLDQISPLRDSTGKTLGVVTISKKVAESKPAGENVQGENTGTASLSLRERQVLQWVARGASSKEIAGKLGISTKTVNTHRARIMQKLNLHKSSELVRYALDSGLA